MSDQTDPTEDMVKREIAAAVEILRSDASLKHSRSMDERLGRLEARFGGGDDTGNGDGKTPPPKKEDPATPPASKKRGLWWGDALEEGERGTQHNQEDTPDLKGT